MSYVLISKLIYPTILPFKSSHKGSLRKYEPNLNGLTNYEYTKLEYIKHWMYKAQFYKFLNAQVSKGGTESCIS